jgi:hypothetical protein
LIETSRSVEVVSMMDGSFRIGNLPAGSYVLSTAYAGLPAGDPVVAEAGATGVLLEMHALGSVEVDVRASDGRPLEGALEMGMINMQGTSGRSNAVTPGNTSLFLDAFGPLDLGKFPEGEYQLWCRAAAYEGPKFSRVVVEANAVSRVEFRLFEGATVHGVVRDMVTSQPLSQVSVIVSGLDAVDAPVIDSSRIVRPDAAGIFEVRGVTRRTVLLFEAPGYRSWRNVGAPAGSQLVVELAQLGDAGGGTEAAGIGVSWKWENGQTIVDNVSPGSQAERAGIVAGDLLRAVDGVTEDKITSINAVLRGPSGSVVTIVFTRADAGTLELSLVRERVLTEP